MVVLLSILINVATKVTTETKLMIPWYTTYNFIQHGTDMTFGASNFQNGL